MSKYKVVPLQSLQNRKQQAQYVNILFYANALYKMTRVRHIVHEQVQFSTTAPRVVIFYFVNLEEILKPVQYYHSLNVF